MEEEVQVEKEVESSYKPTVGSKRNIPVVSPHRPTTEQPSSLSHPHTKGGVSSSVPYSSSFSTSSAAAAGVVDDDGKTMKIVQTKEKEKESEVVDIGFVPSFLDSGRQPRQRR